MQARIANFREWLIKPDTHSSEIGITIAPWHRPPNSALTPPLALKCMSRPQCVNLVLCHNNGILTKLRNLDFPGHYEHRADYENRFIKEHRGYADLREIDFHANDDSTYCMTYGQGLKLLRQIHADLTHRADRGQTLVGARICIATHIILLDSWMPSTELAMFMYIYDMIKSYGCAIPRLLHLSQGPTLHIGNLCENFTGPVHMPGFTKPPAPDQILLAWSGVSLPSEQIPLDTLTRATDAVAAYLIRLAARDTDTSSQIGRGSGILHVIVPNIRAADLIQNSAGDHVLRRGWQFSSDDAAKSDIHLDATQTDMTFGMNIRFTQFSQLINTQLEKSEHLVILPIQRAAAGGYLWLNQTQICAIIGLCGTYRNSANLPLRVAVIDRDMPGNDAWKNANVHMLLSTYPSSPRKIAVNYLSAMSIGEQIKTVCQLAEANIQPGRLLPDAVHSAAGRELVKITSTDDGPKVLRLTASGLFASRASLVPVVARFIQGWQRTPHMPFPAYCVAALFERSLSRRAPLLCMDVETLRRIGNENKYPDPFIHQLSIIVKYIKVHGIQMASPSEMIELAQEYGADPDVLTDIMSRIFALRRCGISTDFRYGPFDPMRLVKILREYKLFPEAQYSPGAKPQESYYTILQEKEGARRHVSSLPEGSPYPPPKGVLVIHTEEEKRSGSWHIHCAASATLLLYASTD